MRLWVDIQKQYRRRGLIVQCINLLELPLFWFLRRSSLTPQVLSSLLNISTDTSFLAWEKSYYHLLAGFNPCSTLWGCEVLVFLYLLLTVLHLSILFFWQKQKYDRSVWEYCLFINLLLQSFCQRIGIK